MKNKIGSRILERQMVKNTILKILCVSVLMLGVIIMGCGKSDNFSGTWAGLVRSAWDGSPKLEMLEIQKNGNSFIIKRSSGSYDESGNLQALREVETMSGTLKDANNLDVPIAFGEVWRITFIEKNKELMYTFPMLQGTVRLKKYDDKLKQQYQKIRK